MNREQYNRFSEDEWKNRKVRNLKPLRIGQIETPAGATFTVIKATCFRGGVPYWGFDLISEPCVCCGVRFVLEDVDYADVDEVP